MTYISGTLTSANPGPALYALIETAMLADGWTLEDTVVIGSNTHKVLKSAAAGNVQGLDWWLDINFPTTGTSGGMRFAPFEDYNSTTHVGYRGPYRGSNTTIDASTWTRYGATGFALETNWANTGGSDPGLSAILSTTAFGYRISVTRNRIIASLDTQGTHLSYAGFFNPTAAFAANAGAALFPLITAKMTASNSINANSTNNSDGACLTRLPKMPSGTGFNWVYNCQIYGGYGLIAFRSGKIADGSFTPSPLTGETALNPMPVSAAFSTTGAGDVWPTAYIGDLLDVVTGVANTTVVRGDHVTVGSDTWYMSDDVSGFVILFKAV